MLLFTLCNILIPINLEDRKTIEMYRVFTSSLCNTLFYSDEHCRGPCVGETLALSLHQTLMAPTTFTDHRLLPLPTTSMAILQYSYQLCSATDLWV